MPQLIIDGNGNVYTQYYAPLPFQAQKTAQIIEKGTTNLFGSVSSLSIDSNNDGLPNAFDGTITYTNQSDIYKHYYWITKQSNPGFNIYIENKVSSSNTTTIAFDTIQIDVAENTTYTFSALSSATSNISITYQYKTLDASDNVINDWTEFAMIEAIDVSNGAIYYGQITTPANAQKIQFQIRFHTNAKTSGRARIEYLQLEEGSTWTSFTQSSRNDGKLVSPTGYHEQLVVYGYFFVPESKRQQDGALVSIGKPEEPNSIVLETTNNHSQLKVSVYDSTGALVYTNSSAVYDADGWTFFQLSYEMIDDSNINLRLFVNDTKVIDTQIECSFDYDDQLFHNIYIGHKYTSTGDPQNWLNGFVSALQNTGVLSDSTIQNIYNNQLIYNSIRMTFPKANHDAETVGGIHPSQIQLLGHIHDDLYYEKSEQDSRFVNQSGDTITGSLTINGSLSVKGGLNMNDTDVTANRFVIQDPGPNEGIEWQGGSGWKIYESPNDLSSNSAGNLQFVLGSSRLLTLDTDGNQEFTGKIYFNHGGELISLNSNAVDGTDAWFRIGNQTYGWYLKFVGSTDDTNGNEFRIESTQTGKYLQIDHDGNIEYYDGSQLRTVWHSGNDGAGSGLDADLLDGQHGSFYRNQSNLNQGTIPVERLSGTYDISISGNQQTQSKLQTQRAIALSGDVSGSATFDGSKDITITQTVANDSHTHTISTITDIQDASVSYADSAGDADTLDGMQPTSLNTQNTIVQRDQNGNFSAGTITANLNGNAATQSKLATQRTITLSGDVSGSQNFDGSSNITITQTVQDNSHNHTSANISDATSDNTANTIVKRDSNGNFSAGTITANLIGNVTGNADTQTKLATQKTIALSGDVTGSQSFDGSSDITIVATVTDNSHNHNEIVNGSIKIKAEYDNEINFDSNNDTIYINHRQIGTNQITQFKFYNGTSSGYQTLYTGDIYSSGTFHGALDGNQSTQSKLQTQRIISLAGDVTGSQSFDGSSNITITQTVANDSHTHDGRYYTESEQDARFVHLSGDTMTGTLTVPDLIVTNSMTLPSDITVDTLTVNAFQIQYNQSDESLDFVYIG